MLEGYTLRDWYSGKIAVVTKYDNKVIGWWYFNKTEGAFWYESTMYGDYEPAYTDDIYDILEEQDDTSIVPLEYVNKYSKRCKQ